MNDEVASQNFRIDYVEHPTTKRIEGFGELKKGWHFGEEGVPFQKTTIAKAVSLNREAVRQGFRRTNAFPGTDGSIAVTVYFRDQYLEFTVELDGNITLYHEQAHKEVSWSEGLSLEEAKKAIGEFRKKWLGYAFLVGNGTGTEIITGFPREHLGQAAISQSRLLVGNVYSSLVWRSAITYGSITRAS